MASLKILLAITLLVEISWAKPNLNKIDIKIPKECNKEGFCSVKPEGYEELEKRMNSLLSPHLINTFADRIGQEPSSEISPESDWHNCPYIKKWDSSYTFRTNNMTKTDYIVQTKLLRQSIQSISCLYDEIDSDSNEQCFQHLGLGAFNMKSTCQTSTVKRSLLVYDADAHEILRKNFDVPCCCTCKITNSLVTLLVVASCAKPNGVVDLKIPDACNKPGFCSIKPEGYDKLEERINRLLSPHLIKSFADRIGQIPEPELSPDDDWHNCPYIKKLDSSYTFHYQNESETDIIIQTKLLSQPIETVTCAYDKIERGAEECFWHLNLNTQNMKSSCETSTAKRSLLVYDTKTNSVKKKDYDVPCCCTC